MKLRLSTFNCENLFSRPKILNFDDNAEAKKPLDKLVKLERILGKASSPRNGPAAVRASRRRA